jgi:hypothetical protein
MSFAPTVLRGENVPSEKSDACVAADLSLSNSNALSGP